MTNYELLKSLEKEGEYLFHGSPVKDIEIIEPRQSTQVIDVKKSTEMINDGKPAISATPYLDVAIFRSIINGKNIKLDYTSSFKREKEDLTFSVSSKEVIEKAKDQKGFVYIFNKSDFEPYDRNGNITDENMEWRSYKTVKPVSIIEVSFKDFSGIDKIQIINT